MEIRTNFGHEFGTSIFQIKDVCVILTLESQMIFWEPRLFQEKCLSIIDKFGNPA
jgi:hypothetical protein